MSTTTVSVGRYRLPALAVVVALVAAIALAVLAVADVTRTSSTREVSAPAADHASTPYWLQRYLEFEAPGSDSTSSSGQEGGTRPPNEGLR